MHISKQISIGLDDVLIRGVEALSGAEIMLLNRSDRRKDGGDKLKPKEFIQHFYYINKVFK